jgi:choline dehydrogenase-like flavoprotein
MPPQRIQLLIHVEQAPNWDSRVRLSRERDDLGQRRIAVDWRLSDLERRTVRALLLTVRAEFARLGLGRVRQAGWLEDADDADWAQHFRDAYHHIGTTRMGTDPSQGVVDTNCLVYGVRGLYVAGSSVFPTSGTANPTLTIMALAVRLADHLKGVLAKGAVMAPDRQDP